MIHPAVYCGDFTEERTVLFVAIPTESVRAEEIRSLWVLTDPLRGDQTAHWTLVIGTWGAGEFEVRQAFPFPGGFPGAPVRLSLQPAMPVRRGELLCVRFVPSLGAVEPLTGVSVLPMFAEREAR